MNAGKEFEYYGYQKEPRRIRVAEKTENTQDYFTLKTQSYIPFDMETIYPNGPPDRIKILQEIYDTERSYVISLTVVDDIFIPQLSMACPKSKKCFRSMFGEISAICKTHQILLESLRTKPIEEVFLKFLPFLKLYTSYASHYPNALKTYAKLMARTDFRKALARIEENPKCEGKKLQAHLIMPIQRIPRYILLIQNLMQYSTEQEDITNLYKTYHGMEGLSEQIQSCMTAYENGERLLTIQLNFGLDGHVLEPGRILLKEGMLYRREINGASNYQETVVFLFNDILLYGVKRISVLPICKYEPTAMLALRHSSVQYDAVGGCILIRCGEIGVDFTADSFGDVNEWYETIISAVENAKKLRDTLRKESFKDKVLVFDRGFWQRHRDRLRNMISTDVTSQLNRVLSRRKPLPKLDESAFLRGEWTSVDNPKSSFSRKRKMVTLDDVERGELTGNGELMDQWIPPAKSPSSSSFNFKGNHISLADIEKEEIEAKRLQMEEDSHDYSFNQRSYDLKTPKTSTPTPKGGSDEDEEDRHEDFTWSDEDEYVPPEKKIPIQRPDEGFDEEDRIPRRTGNVRNALAKKRSSLRRGLAVEDIRRLSYQNRSLEPFNMSTYDNDNDDQDDIDLRVKGEKPRPWWETESAPPVIKNQKSSILDTVKNSCSIM